MQTNYEGIPIRRQCYEGMGPRTVAALRECGIVTAEAIIREGPEALRRLGIRGLTMQKARDWQSRAIEIVSAVPVV